MSLQLISVLVITALFAILGGLIAKVFLKYFKQYKKYALLFEMFFLILTIGELIKEGFAISGFVLLSILAGMGIIYVVDKLNRIRKTETTFNRRLLREFPKAVALGSSFAIDVSLGIAIAILLSLHNLTKGGLKILPYLNKNKVKPAFKELGTIQFYFVIIGLIAFVFADNFNSIGQVILMTTAAGMMLFEVLEEGILLKN